MPVLTEAERWVSADGVKVAIVLLLSFLIGFEREEHKAVSKHYGFGGVRTFPLIGLLGYAFARLSDHQALPIAIGFAAVGAFLLVSYRHKLAEDASAGVTTEITGLMTYLVGAIVERGHYWLAATLAIVSVMLLELKSALDRLAQRINPGEIVPLTKFLILSVVVLPIVPNEALGRFHVNPFRTWLAVVAVSGLSYGSYVLQSLSRGRGGLLLAAVLGGAYSSTITTFVLARRSKTEPSCPRLFAGAILMASGMMYARLALLVALFHATLAKMVAPIFAGLAVLGCAAGWVLSRSAPTPPGWTDERPKNPLELGPAFLFALIFVASLVLANLATAQLGSAGLFPLAALMGMFDVDPFILGVTQMVPNEVALPHAAIALMIATAANNVAKGVYARAVGERAAGRLALLVLVGFALVGLIPIVLWL